MSRGRIRKFIRACSTASGAETTATPRSYCRNIMMSWAMTVPSPRTARLRRAAARSRAIRQEKVWDWVWARRITYFLTVLASLYLAALPVIEKWWPGRGPASPAEVVVPIIDLAAAFLPGFVKPWLDAFRNSPGRFLIGVLLVGVLMYAGGWMQGRIRDLMRGIWRTPGAPATPPGGIVYRLRSAGTVSRLLLPAQILDFADRFRGFDLRVAGGRGSHAAQPGILRSVRSGAGGCAPRAKIRRRDPSPASARRQFETRTLCSATGLSVEKNKSYRITARRHRPLGRRP